MAAGGFRVGDRVLAYHYSNTLRKATVVEATERRSTGTVRYLVEYDDGLGQAYVEPRSKLEESR